MARLARDSSWVRRSFMSTDAELEETDLQNRFFSSGQLSFVDTAPGGSAVINPPIQASRFTDPPLETIFKHAKEVGRYWYEAYYEPMQILHMRLGKPKHNSMTTFMSGFYNSAASSLARTGRAPSALYYLGRAATFVVSVFSIKLLAIHILGRALKFFLDKPSSRFTYLKPTMPLFWNAVNTIFNQLCVYSGITERALSDDQQKISDPYEFDDAAKKRLAELIPDLFDSSGNLDVYSFANRYQRLERRHYLFMKKKLEEPMGDGIEGLSRRYQEIMSYNSALRPTRPSIWNMLTKWFSSGQSTPGTGSGDLQDGSVEGTSADPESGIENIDKQEEEGWLAQLEAELDDGSAFLSVRVNPTGAITESFSSSTAESELGRKMNQISSSSRTTSLNLAGGNIVGGAIGSFIGGVANGIKDMGAGILDQLNISGIAQLGGGGFVTISDHWEDSTTNLPEQSYTMECRLAYTDPVSRMIGMYLPVSCMLATVLPHAAGKQSYAGPFVLEYYDQGRSQSRYAIVSQMSLTRGPGNLPFTENCHPTGVDINFTLKPLDNKLFMPLVSGFSLNPLEGIFDDQTMFLDYMATLSALSLADQIYTWRRFKLNLTRKMASWNDWFSTSHFASFLGDTPPARLISAFYRGSSR